jgi:hypothetical protein
MEAQSSLSSGTAKLLIGQDSIFRVSPSVAKNKFGLDNIKEIKSLKGLGNSEVRKAISDIEIFFTEIAEPFIPIYK